MSAATDDGSLRLVRRSLYFALALSLAANVGHTMLAASAIPTWLRMIGAVAWPVLVFLAVHITVNVAWDLLHGRAAGRHLARMLILIPGIPALITSYEHMHAVLLAMGERPFIAKLGPGAVDLFMIGCTITLVLIQRTARLAATAEPAPERIAPPVLPALEPVEPITEIGRQAADSLGIKLRKPRSTSGDPVKAIEMLIEGRRQEAVDAGHMPPSTMRRYAAVLRDLQQAPQGPINERARKVRPELVEMIRAAVTA